MTERYRIEIVNLETDFQVDQVEDSLIIVVGLAVPVQDADELSRRRCRRFYSPAAAHRPHEELAILARGINFPLFEFHFPGVLTSDDRRR